ncbi:MAG: penicillin acylase family protein [Pseudomonadales bacterium]|nr:penicillin acylase family protein [Pseudomonadales bacterium]
MSTPGRQRGRSPLVITGWLLAGLLLTALVGGWAALRLSLPPTTGELALAGLEAPVSIRFDAWQRPYVQAADLGDALQAQGWLHAGNRLWQMELLRRAGRGRLAELLGADLLPTDRELWRAGVPQLAAKLEAHAGARTLALIDRYLAGVNTAIQAYPLLPPEFLLLGAGRPGWERRDVFALGALMAFQSANNMHNELLRLALANRLDAERFALFLAQPGARRNYPFVLAAPREALARAMDRLALTDPASNPRLPRLGFGSNGWVVAPDRSASGAALYAFDSHDELGLPDLFYEVHLSFGEGRQLRGWSVAGLPGVINGFNDQIAWGFTNTGDTQDLFLETRSPDDPLLFRDGDQWYRARRETVSIPIAGGEPETLVITHTRNGPLVSEEPALSLAWTVHYLERPSLDSLLAFNLAGNWEEFTAALDAFPAPTLNATYADVHGTIGFRTAGALPRRGAGNGLLPQDGSDPAARWQGMVPPGDMPQLANPASGFLAAANARVNAAGDGPLVSADNAPPYRIARIREVLANKEQLSLEDMRALQVDWTDGQAQLLLPTLLAELDRAALDPAARAALPLLQQWLTAPLASPDSTAALLFQQWYLALARQVFEEPTGELYPRLLGRAYLLNNALDQLVLQQGQSPWWRGDKPALLSTALNQAVGELTQRLGPSGNWRLDQLLRVELRHELGRAAPALSWLFNEPDQPWGGSTATVGRARYSYARPFAVTTGATVRAVAEMRPAPQVSSVLPGGQSGHPLSPHYADQYPAWLAGELLPIAAEPAAVEGDHLELVPAY